MSPNPLVTLLHMGEGAAQRRYQRAIKSVEAAAPLYSELSDEELSRETEKLRQRLEGGESLGSILPYAFALVREASARVLGKRHFDVQIFGGIVLAQGNIAEMKTGEGKSLTAVLPAFLHALSGKGVHVVTVNDYLASTQAEQMSRVFDALGMSVGCVTNEMTPRERQVQYARDITYGTSTEFGFDYLRDNMAASLDQQVQRGHHSIILDEVDSILIDEARTPLIISGKSPLVEKSHMVANAVALALAPKVDYTVDKKMQRVVLTEEGLEHAEKLLEVDNIYTPEHAHLIALLDNALKAKELFLRDKQYIVSEEEGVELVDEHTGRVLSGRRYSDSLHQALEAKEGVEIKAENTTMATITLQHYVKLYTHLSGMTGTAYGNSAELARTYGVQVVQIPTNKPVQRVDHEDRCFPDKEAKHQAILQEVLERHGRQQPILIGTANILSSEEISTLLRRNSVPHVVLNAKEIHREADIIAQAGLPGAVTVATNMAGRGTDILLGGNGEHYAESELAKLSIDPIEQKQLYEAKLQQLEKSFEAKHRSDYETVVKAGGLFVLGTERHLSQRIDDQLRGRAGRQGDVGESVFFTSPQDDPLASRYPEDAKNLEKRLRAAVKAGNDRGLRKASKSLTEAMNRAQQGAEKEHEASRANIVKYDDVLAAQRTLIYGERQEVLRRSMGEGDEIRSMGELMIKRIIDEHLSSLAEEEWDVDALEDEMEHLYPCTISMEAIKKHLEGATLTMDDVVMEYQADFLFTFESKITAIGSESAVEEMVRGSILRALDESWSVHLDNLASLQEGIHLRSYSGRPPEAEYQRDAAHLFHELMEDVQMESVRNFFGGKRTLELFSEAVRQGLIVFNVEDELDIPVDTVVEENELMDINGLPLSSRRERRIAISQRRMLERSIAVSGPIS